METIIKQKVELDFALNKMELIPDTDCEIAHEDGKYFVIRKANGYPKTYSVCFAIMGAKFDRHYFYTKKDKEDNPHEVEMLDLLDNLRILLVCRDAYWKIAGDWKYDVNKTEDYFYIVNKCGRVTKEHYMNFNHILVFSSEEMRDAFYENFKDLIEQCKELL